MASPKVDDEFEDQHGGEPPKHAGGRPRIYDTPEQMQMAIDDYFARQDPHIETFLTLVEDKKTGEMVEKEVKYMTKQRPYTMRGLATAIGFSNRRSLVDYAGYGDQFSLTIKKARDRVEEGLEERMVASQGVVAGVIFNAKNNFDYKDRREVEVNDPYASDRKAASEFMDFMTKLGAEDGHTDGIQNDSTEPTEDS